jgi:hypothetical protein
MWDTGLCANSPQRLPPNSIRSNT